MLIAFSGLDGAARSTLTAWLRSELESAGRRVTVLTFRDQLGVYAGLRALWNFIASLRQVDDSPHRNALRARLGRLGDAALWSMVLRVLLYPVDVLLFFAIRFYVEVLRRRVLITDRYFYDRLVDLGITEGPWTRLLLQLTPAPRLAVLLETAEQAEAYHRVFRLISGVMRIRAHEGGAAATAQAVADAIGPSLEELTPRVSLLALRLLLDDQAPLPQANDWPDLTKMAQDSAILVRLADRLAERRAPLPPPFVEAVRHAEDRAHRALTLARALSENCTRLDVPHAFLHMTERYPDARREVEFLINARSADVDEWLLRGIPALRRARKLPHRISGSACYVSNGLQLEIAHGRLGHLGEHARFARQLLARARPQALGKTTVMAPSPEDHVILLAQRQSYARAAFRVGALSWTVRTLRAGQLDWDYLAFVSAALGLLPAVGAYLVYVDRMHARLFGQGLLSRDVFARFGMRGSGRLRAERVGDACRFPATSVTGRVYLEQLRFTVSSGGWVSAARLCLLPMIALMTSVRKAA